MTEVPSRDARFRSVYRAHHAAIRDYCFRRLAPADANDATAEVFLVAWRRMDSVPPGNATLPYLYGIARNTVANTVRTTLRRTRLNARVSALPIQPIDGPETQVVQREQARHILAALDQLSPTDQELLRLKAWEQLTSAEIAEVMDLTTRAVETRLSRARKKLAQQAAAPPTNSAVRRTSQTGGER